MRCVEGGKSKAVVLNGEEGLECEVRVYGIRLEHVSEFKYLECIFNESGTDGAECSRKVAGGRRIAGEIMSLVNAKNLQLECARVLHETLLMPLLMYGVRQFHGKRRRYLDLGCTDGQPQRIAKYLEDG